MNTIKDKREWVFITEDEQYPESYLIGRISDIIENKIKWDVYNRQYVVRFIVEAVEP